MHDDPVALWQAALKDLSSQVSRANYDTWLDGTTGVRLEQDHLVVGTRSEFVTEWLQKRLRPAIIRSLTDLAGHPLDVTFEPLRSVEDQVAALNELAGTAQRSSQPRPRLLELAAICEWHTARAAEARVRMSFLLEQPEAKTSRPAGY